MHLEAAGIEPSVRARTINTLYIGGGTPTVLSVSQLEGLWEVIRKHFSLSDDAECTVEANPNSVTKEKLSQLQRDGVNRLSLGIQSFSDEVLRTLGRMHTSSVALDAIRLAKTVGFSSIAFDLMYGIPGQTMDQWLTSLDRAVREQPDHISVYALSLDEGSRFTHEANEGRLALPEDDRTAEMYEAAADVLERAGYPRYEISNFCRPGHECRHNLNYWIRGQYLGIGAGAWSFISGERHSNIADVAAYCSRLTGRISAVDVFETPDPDEAARETVFLRLRTATGLDLDEYRDAFGETIFSRLESSMAPLLAAGLLETRQGRLILTKRGILLSNEVFARL